MSREIKFRAWDANEKEMAYMDDEYADVNYTPNENIANFFNFYYGCEMLQFTGLKDKNGKEIYEGDILLHKQSNPLKIVCRYFTDNHFFSGLRFEYPDGTVYNNSIGKNYEVIGNVFQNPELIKL